MANIVTMGKILIKNIKGLVQCGENLPKMRRGADMKTLPILENAFLALEDGVIVAYGSMEDWGGITDWRDLEVIDAEGKFVLPAFCLKGTPWRRPRARHRRRRRFGRCRGLSSA